MKVNLKLTRNEKIYLHQSGITLIALVVTIVVLLILAGVTISSVFSDNGIIKKAQDSQLKINTAQKNELDNINKVDKWITESTVQMIAFTAQDVNGKDKTYKVEKGMTWKQAFEAGYFDNEEDRKSWYEMYGTAEKQKIDNKYWYQAYDSTNEYIVTDVKCYDYMIDNNRIYLSGIKYFSADGSQYDSRTAPSWYYIIPEGATKSSSSQVKPDDVITPDGKYVVYNDD